MQDEHEKLLKYHEQQEEEDYFVRASKRVFKPELLSSALKALKQTDNNAEFLGVPSEGQAVKDSDMNEVEKLREENKRLKRTLLERFQAEYK